MSARPYVYDGRQSPQPMFEDAIVLSRPVASHNYQLPAYAIEQGGGRQSPPLLMHREAQTMVAAHERSWDYQHVDYHQVAVMARPVQQTVQAVPMQVVQAQPVQHVQQQQHVQQLQIQQVGPVQLQPVQDEQHIQVRMPMIRQPPAQAIMHTYDPPPRHFQASHNQPIEDEIPKQKPRIKNMQRSAPPPPRAEEEEEDLPVFKKEKSKVQRAAGPPAAAAPPPPERKVEIRTKAVEVDKLELVPSEREVVTFDVVNTTRNIDTDRVRENVREYTSQIPQFVERVITKDVPVPNFIKTDRVVEKTVVKEKYVDKVIIKEIPVQVERVVVKEVPVFVDKVVDRIVYKEVDVEKVITKEVPYEVEKIEYREVQVPVERVVDKVVEVPYDKVVFHDKVVYQDKVVFNDKPVEVPVERHVGRVSPVQYYQMPGEATVSGGMYGSMRELSRQAARQVGLGVVLRRDESEQVFVKEIIAGFAAHRQGGLQVNDVLLTVDGNPLANLDLEDIKHLTVGDEGSVVKLELRRDGVEKSTILQRTPGEMVMASGYTHNPPLHSTAPR